MKLITTALAATLAVGAAQISVFSTGVDNAGATTPIGTVDTHWTLISKPVGSSLTLGGNPVRFNCCYVADNAISGWVSPTSFGSAGAFGVYTYAQTFDLTGFDLSTIVLTGGFSTDNDGELYVNSTLVASSGFAGFGSLTGWGAPTSAFVAGINTLYAKVNNGGDPTALRVEIRQATGELASTTVPEPSTLALAVAGLGAAALLRRRG